MKLLGRHFERNGGGRLTVIPEEIEDIWHLYNLIQPQDQLKASTLRKVTTETSTGSTSSQRVHTVLTIEVVNVEYDTQAGTLHVKGRNVVENQYVKLGSYHTLDLELQRKVTLVKTCWDSICLDRVEQACNPAARADVAAVVMQEGIAHVCLVTQHMTILRAKIDMNVPHKRKGFCGQHDKGLAKFYDAVMRAVLQHVDLSIVSCVIIASPGFVKDQFFDYMMREAAKRLIDDKAEKRLVEEKSKFLLVHSSSGFKHALNEVLADQAVATRLANTKASAEVRALADFYSILNTEPARAYYGIAHVQRAAEAQAVETLLVTDALFRSHDFVKRQRYVRLCESVRDSGGMVRIFSSLHVSGVQLGLLTGVAAILRYPMPELEEDDEDEDEEQEPEQNGHFANGNPNA